MPLSLALAFIQVAWPYTYAVRNMVPDTVLLVCLYWTLRRPHEMTPVLCLLIGLSRDALQGTLLGQHVLSITITLYVCQRFAQRARLFTRWQQTLAVMLLAAVYMTTGHWIHLLNNPADGNEHILLSSLVTGLCWPLVHGLLRWIEGRGLRPATA